MPDSAGIAWLILDDICVKREHCLEQFEENIVLKILGECESLHSVLIQHMMFGPQSSRNNVDPQIHSKYVQ